LLDLPQGGAARLSGAESITEYAWGAMYASRSFCKRCGVHCFGRGHLKELGGDFVSINYNSLDDVDPLDVSVAYWDGRHDNWQAGTRPTPWRMYTASGENAVNDESAAPAALRRSRGLGDQLIRSARPTGDTTQPA
jgi:hypothetical protein